MRLIDADALEYAIETLMVSGESNGYRVGLGAALTAVLRQPTITAALTPETQASAADNTQWRPIEEAPRDSRYILARYSVGNHHDSDDQYGCECKVVKWVPLPEGVDPSCNAPYWSSFGPGIYRDSDFSDWMPIPEPPAIEGGEG